MKTLDQWLHKIDRVLLAEAFTAFMGMAVRVRESGQWRGRRKLTKKGDPEVRK